MKNNFSIAILLFMSFATFAQQRLFTAEVDRDTVLLGNSLQLTIKAENMRGEFTPPELTGFERMGGTNQSSSMSVINGVVSQSMTYSWWLKPTETGMFYIEPASFSAEDGEIFETSPISVLVLPNPDGIVEEPKSQLQFRLEDPFQLWNADSLMLQWFSPFDADSMPVKKEIERKKLKTIRI